MGRGGSGAVKFNFVGGYAAGSSYLIQLAGGACGWAGWLAGGSLVGGA